MRQKRNVQLITLVLLSLLFVFGVTAIYSDVLLPAENQPIAGLVPCDGVDCDFCDLFQLTDNIFDLIVIYIVPALAILMIAIGGVYLFFGGPSEESRKRGKRIIRNAIIGLIIVYAAWIIVGTILGAIVKNLGGDFNFTVTKGIEIECNLTEPTVLLPPVPETPAPETTRPGGTPMPTLLCEGSLAGIADFYGTAYPRTNSPELNSLVSCVQSGLAARGNSGLLDTGQIFTYERDEELCNYTRGTTICGVLECQHSLNSCHYGGSNGTTGARGVDFNAVGGSRAQERALSNAISALRGSCNLGRVGFEESGSGSNYTAHTHVNTSSCVGP